MAATKKWAQEGILVQEADCHLDFKLFLDEYPRWRADGPQCPYILQRMCTYAKEVGQNEQEWVIHQGHQQPVPREDAEVKTLAVQMEGFWTTQEEIQGIYNEEYQQKRLLGPHHMGQGGWKPLTGKSVLLLEEQAWQKQGMTRLGEDLQGATAPILWPSCQTKFCHWTQGRNEDPHNQALSETREAYRRALEATHLLEQSIKRLSQAADRAKSAKCWHPYSHSHSRGGPQGRHAQSPSHNRLRKHLTFQDQEEETSSREGPLGEPQGQVTRGGEVEESNLGPSPTLGPELEHFLEIPTTTWGARDKKRLTTRAINW